MSGKRIRELEGLSGAELTQKLAELKDQREKSKGGAA
jgi:cytochrome c553